MSTKDPFIKARNRSFRYCITWIMVILALAIFLPPTQAIADSQIILITSTGCAKCAAADRVLTAELTDYGNAPVEEQIFSSEDGLRTIKEHKAKDVPTIIIGDSVIGYRDYDRNETELKRLIGAALEGQNISSVQRRNGPEDNLDAENGPQRPNSIIHCHRLRGWPFGGLQPMSSGNTGIPGKHSALQLGQKR